MKEQLRVAVVGAGKWARAAHLPAFHRSPLAQLTVICDLKEDLARERAAEFGVPEITTDVESVLRRDDIDVVDICTRGDHQDLVFATLEAGKHCLVEKPVASHYRDVWRAHEMAESRGLKTKVGLTFRHAPAMRYMLHLVREGFVGQPYIFNGFEQNSQWLDPDVPMDKRDLEQRPEGERKIGADPRPEAIEVSSLEGYGAPIIDISLCAVGDELREVVGTMKNFVPYRRRTNLDTARERINIDDASMYLGTYANGALCSIQTSYVTVGNYPGVEARIYGSEGALICRLVEEDGNCQTLHAAKPDSVEFQPLEVPREFFPPGYTPGEGWASMFYANLVHDFMEEIVSGEAGNRGDFADSARVQEIINAVERSFRERGWVQLPLEPRSTG